MKTAGQIAGESKGLDWLGEIEAAEAAGILAPEHRCSGQRDDGQDCGTLLCRDEWAVIDGGAVFARQLCGSCAETLASQLGGRAYATDIRAALASAKRAAEYDAAKGAGAYEGPASDRLDRARRDEPPPSL